jgi:hypothetical protein
MSDLARRFHDTYERLAPDYGYTTRADAREFDPDSPNGRLMAAVCSEVLGALEAEVWRLQSREAYFARALGVADGGQYRTDWDAAITRVLVQKDKAEAEVERLREALRSCLEDWDEHGILTWDALHLARSAVAGGRNRR